MRQAQGIPAQVQPNVPVGVCFFTTRYVLKTLCHRPIKNVIPLATFLSTLHQALFRPPFPSRLLPGSLPTHLAKREQRISDNSPVVVSTTPMHGLIPSPWNLQLLVELKWRLHSRPLMTFEAVFCQGTSLAPFQNHQRGR
jgi:hypothetical protein